MKKLRHKIGLLLSILFIPIVASAISPRIDINSTNNTNIIYKIGAISPAPKELNVSLKNVYMKIEDILFLSKNLTKDINLTKDMNITKRDKFRNMDSNISKLLTQMDMLRKNNDDNVTDTNQKILINIEINNSIQKIKNLKSLVILYRDNNATDLNKSSQTLTPRIMMIKDMFGIKREYRINQNIMTNSVIVMEIKKTLNKLYDIKKSVDRLKDINNSITQIKYDALKQEFDMAMSHIDAIKSSIDNNFTDTNITKNNLKVEADKIKSSINDIKTQVDRYKENNDTSIATINKIQDSIDLVIEHLTNGNTKPIKEKIYIDVVKGRSVISANIDIHKLPSDIYAVWIVDKGNWYGYSPDTNVTKSIASKYRLINKTIPSYKATIVWAKNDTKIEILNKDTIPNVTQYYGKGYSIHGANNEDFTADSISCNDTNSSVTAMFKVKADKPSIYKANMKMDNNQTVETFNYVYNDEGYYVLCERK